MRIHLILCGKNIRPISLLIIGDYESPIASVLFRKNRNIKKKYKNNSFCYLKKIENGMCGRNARLACKPIGLISMISFFLAVVYVVLLLTYKCPYIINQH